MPPLAQITPDTAKQIMALDGWKIRREDEFNYLMSKGRRYFPIPRKCRTLPFAIMDQFFSVTGLGGQKYFDLLHKANESEPPTQSAQRPFVTQ